MLHTGRKPRYFESQDVLRNEPCLKRMKSTEESYGKSYDGLQRLHDEVHVKKTHSGFIPLNLSDNEEERLENNTVEVLNPSQWVFSSKATAYVEPSDSVNNTEVSGNKTCFTKNADVIKNRENNDSVGKSKNEEETQLYSTSKAFIGPIYKNEADQQRERKNHTKSSSQKFPDTMVSSFSKRELASKQACSYDVPKIEDELSQFYSEIHQLEGDDKRLDGYLQGTEASSHEHRWNQIACVSSEERSYNGPSSNCGSSQCSYSELSNHRTHSEQCPYSDSEGHRTDNQLCFDSFSASHTFLSLCNKQAGSRFCYDSVPPFRPGWQEAHQFIKPYGPPPPQFTPHFNVQKHISSLDYTNTFPPPNVGPFKNAHINISCSPSNQNSECTSHFGICGMQSTTNGYTVPDRPMDNGFCETSACFKDAKMYQTEEASSVCQQFPEDKLCKSQKLLQILRGLPGSGKTTLSRILLGQSRDGVVYSTDDYFRQQDGCWSYNVGQLGVAHDWNQKRAKQAMDQGRSPVIIDNTNTQAWEMKPYVEAALEKGYRVEFCEPDTWWKFAPEELEKRNEHGVSREKIVQMLERYEYQVTIPTVMNSVLPFHKTLPRPPPQRRQRETVEKKKHRLHKIKQKRKRKRNRKVKGAAIKGMEKKLSGPLNPSAKDSSTSEGEESEDNEEATLATYGNSDELVADGKDSSASDSLKPSDLEKGGFLLSDLADPETLDSSLKTNVIAEDSLKSLPSDPSENVTDKSSSDLFPYKIQNKTFVESNTDILEHNYLTKFGNNSTENNTDISNREDKVISANAISEPSRSIKSLDDEKEVTDPRRHAGSKKEERNTWAFFSFDLAEKCRYASSDKNEPCLTWLEGASKVIYEQRPKKEKRSKQVFLERTTEFPSNNSASDLERISDGQVLNEGDNLTDCFLSILTEKNKTSCIETVHFSTKSAMKERLSSGANTLASSQKKGCKKIFHLAPNFDLPRQIAVRKDEKVLEDINEPTEQVLKEEARENSKQSLGCHECPSTNRSVVEFSHFDVDSLSCNSIPNNLQKPIIFSKEEAVSPIQISTASCKTSCLSARETIASDQAVSINIDRKRETTISPDVSFTLPDSLDSVNVIAEYLADSSAENSEKMQEINEMESMKYFQIGDEQNPLNNKPDFLGLPLSLGFAHQLIELFGAPGVPLDTLLPDDFVVPLDWATSRDIYLQWKTSVEKKQKKSVSKDEKSLFVGARVIEESNKDGHDKPESSEANPLGENIIDL